jgi:hypothetical protein
MQEAARVAVIDDVDAVARLARQAVAELTPQRGGSVWARREARAEPFEEALVAALEDPRHLVLISTSILVPVVWGSARR